MAILIVRPTSSILEGFPFTSDGLHGLRSYFAVLPRCGACVRFVMMRIFLAIVLELCVVKTISLSLMPMVHVHHLTCAI